MPKPIARRKTKKSVAKRFKVTATGKIKRGRASRRHLMASKNAKKKRQLARPGLVHETADIAVNDEGAFRQLVEKANAALQTKAAA